MDGPDLSDAQLLEHGLGYYSDIKHFPDGERAWLCRFAFTSAILYGLTEDWGYRERWCYETMADARRALGEWNGVGDPEGWHRHIPSGRRRDLATGKEWIQP